MSIDHLVLGVSDLEHGISFVEHTTGVRPTEGGRHTHLGTHNAILSLGPRCYLEILAPDPTQSRLVLALAALAQMDDPRLVKWAVAGDVDRAANVLRATVVPDAEIESGARMRPDGSAVKWRQVGFLTHTRIDVPFVIDWAPDSVHPASGASTGCSLASLEVVSTEVESLSLLFEALDAGVRLHSGPQAVIRAALDTPLGEVNLMS